MAENTAISWADHTFNPWIGCAKVSPACDGCYAEAQMGVAGRFGPARAQWGGPGKGEGTRSRTAASTWKLPHKWNRQAASAPGQTFVFCASLADVFDNAVPSEWRRDLFDLIHATPHLTWLLLTKRTGNIIKLFDLAYRPDGQAQSVGERAGNWPSNAAIGCTVVSQEEADRDIPKLLAAKAALKPAFAFLSMEPLLGPVDLTRLQGKYGDHHQYRDALRGSGHGWPGATIGGVSFSCGLPALDWVITGGETDQGGHKARPAHPDWFRSLRDQCAAAEVPFHFKQWGEWGEACEGLDDGDGGHLEVAVGTDEAEALFDPKKNALVAPNGQSFRDPLDMPPDVACRLVERLGSKAAGRRLDGVTHDARPVVRRDAAMA